jgi:hypothetical protein
MYPVDVVAAVVAVGEKEPQVWVHDDAPDADAAVDALTPVDVPDDGDDDAVVR